jgi:hypothetical protein
MEVNGCRLNAIHSGCGRGDPLPDSAWARKCASLEGIPKLFQLVSMIVAGAPGFEPGDGGIKIRQYRHSRVFRTFPE